MFEKSSGLSGWKVGEPAGSTAAEMAGGQAAMATAGLDGKGGCGTLSGLGHEDNGAGATFI